MHLFRFMDIIVVILTEITYDFFFIVLTNFRVGITIMNNLLQVWFKLIYSVFEIFLPLFFCLKRLDWFGLLHFILWTTIEVGLQKTNKPIMEWVLLEIENVQACRSWRTSKGSAIVIFWRTILFQYGNLVVLVKVYSQLVMDLRIYNLLHFYLFFMLF